MASHTGISSRCVIYRIPGITLLMYHDHAYRTERGAHAGGTAAAAVVASASDEEAAPAGKKTARPQQQSRKNHEVHPGSYAGGWQVAGRTTSTYSYCFCVLFFPRAESTSQIGEYRVGHFLVLHFGYRIRTGFCGCRPYLLNPGTKPVHDSSAGVCISTAMICSRGGSTKYFACCYHAHARTHGAYASLLYNA